MSLLRATHYPLLLICPVDDHFHSGTCNQNARWMLWGFYSPKGIDNTIIMFTVELSRLVSHLERRVSALIPSALWMLKTPTPRGHGLVDNDPACSDDMTSNNMLIQQQILKYQNVKWDLAERHQPPQHSASTETRQSSAHESYWEETKREEINSRKEEVDNISKTVFCWFLKYWTH